MNDVVTGVIRWVLRLVVLAMGVLFFLSLLAAAAVLALGGGALILAGLMLMEPRRDHEVGHGH